MTSPRLCGGMLVAMPTAMPPAPLTRRFGNFAGRTDGSRSRAVVVGLEIDGVLVDIVEQRLARSWSGGLRCIAWPPADRRRPSRNCPGRRSAARAWRNPAPSAPSRHRSTGRRADDIYRSRRRRRAPTCRTSCSRRMPLLVHRVQNAAMHGLQPVARIRQRPRHDHAHGVIEVGALHLVEDGNGTNIGGLRRLAGLVIFRVRQRGIRSVLS